MNLSDRMWSERSKVEGSDSRDLSICESRSDRMVAGAIIGGIVGGGSNQRSLPGLAILATRCL